MRLLVGSVLAVLILSSLLVLCSAKDRCGKRSRYAFSRDFRAVAKGRKSIKIKKTVTITSNNGKPKKLIKGQSYHFCGCDKGGTCVLYTEGPNKNADGSTFFANVPAKALGVKPGKTLFKFWRGAPALRGKPKKVWQRKVRSNPKFSDFICHGGTPGKAWCAGLWEYIKLKGRTFTTGAMSPASYWVKGKKVGRGFNTGLFKNGMRFTDVCVQKINTPVRNLSDTFVHPSKGTGKATWVFGYVTVKKNIQVWTWMIESVSISGGVVRGNIA